MKKYQRIISIILIISIFVTSCPMEIFAQEIPNIFSAFEKEDKLNENEESKIIGEIKEERKENVKHFLKEDKSYEAAIYPNAVHYKDKDEWKDIDNSLVEKLDSEENQNVLENKENEYKIKIANNTKAKKTVKIKKDNYELSWNIDNASNSKAEIIDNDYSDSLSKEEQKKILPNISSSVEFKDVYENVDFRYDLISKDIKESIIIKEKLNDPVFRFNIKLKNLVPKLQEDKTIIFYDAQDTSKQVFMMDAPFMYDAKSEISNDIQLNIKENKNEFILELVPNKEWINSTDRVYPITIDPSVSTPIERTTIKDTHVSEKLENDNFWNGVMLKTGKGLSSGINRSYLSFDLPELKTGDLITNANLDLALYSSYSEPTQVNVHKVLETWEPKDITWNKMPKYNNSKIEDYAIAQGQEGKFLTWNITGIVKEWYSSGNNYGLMIKNNDETAGYTEYCSSDISESGFRPQVTIDYINNSGLEDYWTYHSQDIGRAGTGHINDYNGNFVLVHDDLDMNGNRMPISLNHVFNSNDRSSTVGYGMGWRLNLNQRLAYQIINGTQYYIYTDEDGTKHYLKHVTTETYKDESGLDLTMTIDPSSSTERYKLKDKGGSQLSFNPSGYLAYIKDNNDNKISLGYSGTTLKTITDGAGRVTNLNVDANGTLTTIVDPSNRTTSFAYDGSNRLTKITYSDSKYSTYSYDTNNNLTSATNFDGYKIAYTYYGAAPYRVQKAQESHTNGTLGEEISVSYGYNMTSFTDYKGRKNTYQFSNQGNTVNIKDNDGSAQYYKYFADGGNKNKLNSQSKLQKTILNYLKNHNMEENSNWDIQSSANSTGNASFTAEQKNMGNQSLKVQKTNTIGDYNYQQIVNVDKGKTYTYSGYIKAQNISNVNNQGATIYMTYEKNDGSWGRVTSEYVKGTKDWDRYEFKFTVPSDMKNNYVVIKAGIVGETGVAYFDNLQLEDGPIANRYNLVENADFKYGTSVPDFWTKNTDCNTEDVLSSVTGQPASLDNKAFKLNGDANKKKNISQKINISGKKGESIVFGGWSKGDSVPGKNYAVDIGIEKTDGTYQWLGVSFNEDSNEWQYTSGVAIAEGDYKSINIYAVYYNNANSAYFDGLQLYKEEFDESYQYDSNGNVVSTKDLDKQNSQFGYNTNNDLIKSTDPKGNNFKYNYDSKHNMLDATSAENVVYSFTYDAYGNPLTSKVGDSSLFINSSSTYTANGNYIKTLKDSKGNVATHNYDETKGNLNSVVDANGKTTSYSYDNMDRLQNASKDVDGTKITNSYSYENDKLKTITHNGFNYNFGYDSLGNNTTVSVGNQNLMTNIYEPRSSKLLELKYGNNQKVSSVYDNEDRVISEKYTDKSNNTQERFKYGYDASGNLGLHEDLVNKLSYRHMYDLSDRLVKTKESNGNEISYNYDANNNNNKITEKINNNTYVTSYGYDKDDRPTSVTTPKGKTENYTYDKIGRKSNSIINTGNAKFSTSYSYEEGIDGSTTNSIKSINNDGKELKYTHDKNGNISTITKDKDGLIAYYSFDNNDIADDSGNGNDGKIYGNPTFVPGKKGNALKLDGVDDWAELTNFDVPETFSVSMWINPYKFDKDQNYIGKHEDNGNNLFLIGDYGVGTHVKIRNSSNVGGEEKTGYQHLVVTVKKISATQSLIKVYKDNVLTWEKTINDVMGNIKGKPWVIGQDWDANVPTDFFNGEMDEVAFYNYDLSDSKISQVYNQGVEVLTNDNETKYHYNELDELIQEETKDKDGLLAYYNFDKEDILDNSGNKNDGKTYGEPKYIPGKKGKALELDGIDDWAELTDFDVPETFSVSMWINPYKFDKDQNYIGKHEDNGNNLFLIGDYGVGTHVKIRNSSNVGGEEKTGYQHLVVTVKKVSPTQSLIKVYKDNVLTWEKTINDVMGNTKGKAWVIGQDWDDNVPTDFFNGAIDEVAFYDHSLTNGERSKLYNEGVAVSDKKVVKYTYDSGGNILKKEEYKGDSTTPSKTNSYAYDDANWKDKLTAFNGKTILYDEIGNPLGYDRWIVDENDEPLYYEEWILEWEEGRQLSKLNRSGVDISYKYNSDGIRTEKTVDGVTTKYHVVDGNVTFETNGSDNIYYTYDSEDKLVSIELNGVEYYYVRNVQGDIIGLIDDNGNEVVSYTYDTWGKLLSIDGSLKDSLGIKNPYRYRGYRYDNETELYYLQSRYYNPEWGRFLNADSVVGETGELLSHNMFAYCANDPVNNEDPDGFSPVKILIKGGQKLWPIAKKQIPRVYKIVKKNIKAKPNQIHHFITNKSKKYTPVFKKVINKYNLDLDGSWNKKRMPHQGRHPYAYHDYVLTQVKKIDSIAKGNQAKFLNMFEGVKNKISKNPNMLYKNYWKK